MRVRSGLGLMALAIAMVPQLLSAAEPQGLLLDDATRDRCLQILRSGLQSDEFWPSIHAAEGLTLAGQHAEVARFLTPKLQTEKDSQHLCGISRELVRGGDLSHVARMLRILSDSDPHGHVHAAESLYKVGRIGDGNAMRAAFARNENMVLKLMSAGALARCGNPQAMKFLRESLKDSDPQNFRIAAWILGRIGDESDVPRIKQQLPRCPDALVRAFLEHALAGLKDPAGLQALARNLKSTDPDIRTYAATFAGDARAHDVAAALKRLLDDEHADARYRAAQSLLVLSNPAPADPVEDISQIVFASTPQNPRYTEGSILELVDGRLLFAVTEFQNSGSDFAQARIVARSSSDAGRTWGTIRELQKNTGGLNVMSVSLRRIAPDRVALFYLQKNSFSDLDMYVRYSTDETQTFGAPILITDSPGYHVVNNDRITRLSSGRLLAPAASTPDVKQVNHFVSHCFISDDNGQTWRDGQGQVDAQKRGAMEPEVIELRDGRVLMIVRTQMGYIGQSFSKDGGETWSKLQPASIKAPEAPATLRRIPSTGDLVLIWNNTFTPGAGHGGRRTPLTAAISNDEGQSWRVVGDLETDAKRTFSYTSLMFAGNRAILSYWDNAGPQYSCRFRSIPVSWFYR